MRWYLPDRYPIFWNEQRRILYSLRKPRILERSKVINSRFISYSVLMAGLFLVLFVFRYLDWVLFSVSFEAIYGFQLVSILLISPLLTANAFARERERGSLDFLLLTPTRTNSLVRQKLLGRSIPLLLLVLPGSIFTSPLIYVQLSPAQWFSSNMILFILMWSTLLLSLAIGCLFSTSRVALITAYSVSLVLAFLMMILVPLILENVLYAYPHYTYYDFDSFINLVSGEGSLLSQIFLIILALVYLPLSAISLFIAENTIGKMRCSSHNERPLPATVQG